MSCNGEVVLDPFALVDPERDLLELRAGAGPAVATEALYLMLNKPRGLITSRADERGRDTVYACLEGSDLPWVAPVGRLDKASEGLLLFTNDTAWAAALMDPARHQARLYHVQVEGQPTPSQLEAMATGYADAELGQLGASRVSERRRGARNCWLEIELLEGRNRQIRRLCEHFELPVLRLVRIGIGALRLGELAKGQWRHLRPEEVATVSGMAGMSGTSGLSG